MVIKQRYTKDILRRIALQNKEHFTTVTAWNRFAVTRDYPRGRSFAYHFGSWNKAKIEIFKDAPINESFEALYSIDELATIAKDHKGYFVTAQNWKSYALIKGLPSAKVYVYSYGSWNNALMEIFKLDQTELRLYLETRLIKIAKENRQYFTTAMTWSKYAKENHYPTSKTYNNHFGPWETVKSHIFGNDAPPTHTDIKMKAQYTLSELKEIARKHQEYFTTYKEWNVHAEKNSLPWAGSFASYFGTWHKAKIQIFGQDSIKSRNKYTKESLKEIAIKHRIYFTTIKEWDTYARENKLPHSNTFIFYYGRWSKAKKIIFQNVVERA